MAFMLSFGMNAIALPVTKAAITSMDSAAPASVIVSALNQELGGSLTADQIAAIQNVEAEQQQQEFQLHRVGLTVGGKNVSLLVCVSGKAAVLVKGRVGICSTLGGDIYNLFGYGAGVSVGAKMSVFGVAVIAPEGQSSIDGTYGAAATAGLGGVGYVVKGMLDASAWRIQLHGLLRFLLAFGGPEFALAHAQDSLFVMAGLGIGPMFDVGLEWFRLIQKS